MYKYDSEKEALMNIQEACSDSDGGFWASEGVPFVPDILLPVQVGSAFGRGSRVLGERGLILAILEQALEDYREYSSGHNNYAKRMFADAEAWIFAQDMGWYLFSFENICEALEIEPNYIRRMLLTRKPLDLDSPEAQLKAA